MTAQEYITTTIASLKTPTEAIADTGADLESAIYAKVMSKKFRKLKADDLTVDIVKKAIHIAASNNQPVKINVIFGGNKLWRFEEAPEIDWSELFVTLYFARWMKSIASVYAPGVYLEFYSEDVVLETMNNLPPEETDRYSETFRAMLAWLKPQLPPSIEIAYRRYGEDYADRAAFKLELDEAITKVSKELGGKLPELTDHQRAATEMNVRLKSGQADDPLWREKAELIHQSIERTKTMEAYIADPQYIPVCPTYFSGCIATGSTKKSYAKFWVGVGALEPSNDGYQEIVLTPSQLETAQFEWEPVHIDGLVGKNFSRIRVLKK